MLIDCPLELITADIWDAITAADLARKGCWYMHGGWGDQPAIAVEAIQFLWAQEARWRRPAADDT